MSVITDAEFTGFQRFIYEAAGISLSAAKKQMVSGRLAKRLSALGLPAYTQYLALLKSGKSPGEVQTAIDLLTTNETFFFREPKHFEMLHRLATSARERGSPLAVWSAACSTGEEPYSIAMVLAECMPDLHWSVSGSDISDRVLQRARVAHYPLSRAQHIPQTYLKRFCLKGRGEQEGTLLVERSLRGQVTFQRLNLNEDTSSMGRFDVIFLRNVLIYFNPETKRRVVERVLSHLKPGGHFFIGHSETLNEVNSSVLQLAPSIYRKAA
jgi:chemotaxis protein methyltransferase CheR